MSRYRFTRAPRPVDFDLLDEFAVIWALRNDPAGRAKLSRGEHRIFAATAEEAESLFHAEFGTDTVIFGTWHLT